MRELIITDFNLENVERQILKTLVEEGLTYKDIANKIGISDRTLYRKLKSYKLINEKESNSKNTELKILKTLIEQGLTYKDIANMIGISERTLYRKLKSYKLNSENESIMIKKLRTKGYLVQKIN